MGGIVALEEINAARASSLSRFFGVFDNRSFLLQEHAGEVVRAHDTTSFIACQNPGGSDTGIEFLSHRMRGRFPVRLNLGYDEATEAKLVPDPRIRAVFRSLRESTAIHTPASTRLLHQYATNVTTFGPKLARAFLVAAFEEDERDEVRETLGNGTRSRA